MIVAGIDLSLSSSGYAILNSETSLLIESGVIKTRTTVTHKAELERLRMIVERLMVLLNKQEVKLVAIEGLAFMATKTTSIMQLAGLNYLLRNALYLAQIPFIIVAPSTLKKFVTGKGNGPKDIMMLEIFKRWDLTITDNNIADAFGLSKVSAALVSPEFNELTQPQKEVIKLIKPQYNE